LGPAFQLRTQPINASLRKSLTITLGTTFIFILSLATKRLNRSFFCGAIVCLLVTGPPRAFSRTRAPEGVRATLTFAERVAYQYAIEEVYWRHRIWPKENPGPKPPLDAIVSQRQIEQKVEDYLLKSQLALDQRGWRITSTEVQAEMNRMATHTKQPGVLRELFDALGDDPFVIAECLARPILTERVVSELSPRASAMDGSPSAPALGLGDAARPPVGLYQTDDAYKLPEISGSLDCTDNTWSPSTTANAPDGRSFYTALWTGSEMIVWGGFNFNGRLNSGGKYDPATDSWIPTDINNAPSPRDYHSAVWIGSEMIVWGGEPILNTGARYNPIADSWTATSTTNAPTARASHTAVWTGTEMIVWGGRDQVGRFNTGGRYDPGTDSWTPTNTTNAPTARAAHTAVWTGTEMVIWGGTDQTNLLHTGGKYNPSMDSWTATSTVNVPLGRIAHTAVWTGSEVIVWGGVDETFNDTNTGGTYNAGSPPASATRRPREILIVQCGAAAK
jgi:hypothetical protein